MNFADLLLVTILLGTFGSSCYLLRQFFLSWKPAHYHENLANPLPLPWLYFLGFVAGFVLCYWKAHEYIILYAVGGILCLLATQGHSPSFFWNLKSRDFLLYLQKGLTTYLTFFIPFSLLTAACTYLFTALGFKDINQPAVEMLMQSKGFWPIFGFLLFACVVAPVWEEITFRGFLYPFLKAKTGKTPALILSSLLFAAMHMHLPSLIPLGFLGALLALLYERTGSLGYNIMLHSFFNFSTCLFLLLLKYGSNPQLWKSM